MKAFAVVGHPIQHSLSPLLFEAGFLALNLSYTYTKEDVPSSELRGLVEKVKTGEYSGLSITIPYKEEIIPYLDELTPEAKKIGAVNTVFLRDGKVVGENTDWVGFKQALEKHVDIGHKKILIYGAGGVARACLFALKDWKENIFITNRTEQKGKGLADELGMVFVPTHNLPEVDVVINATSNDIEIANKNTLVFDLKYTGNHPEFAKEMLLNQAVKQFEIFTGLPAPVEAMSEVIKS